MSCNKNENKKNKKIYNSDFFLLITDYTEDKVFDVYLLNLQKTDYMVIIEPSSDSLIFEENKVGIKLKANAEMYTGVSYSSPIKKNIKKDSFVLFKVQWYPWGKDGLIQLNLKKEIEYKFELNKTGVENTYQK